MAISDSNSLVFFAHGVKFLRNKYGLSQQALADKARVSSVTINHIENVRSGAVLATLDKIAAALNSDIPTIVMQGQRILHTNQPELRFLFGANLKRRRLDIEMSQETLAKLSMVSVQTIRNMETGRKSATLDVVERVANALKVEPFSLLLAGDA